MKFGGYYTKKTERNDIYDKRRGSKIHDTGNPAAPAGAAIETARVEAKDRPEKVPEEFQLFSLLPDQCHKRRQERLPGN